MNTMDTMTMTQATPEILTIKIGPQGTQFIEPAKILSIAKEDDPILRTVLTPADLNNFADNSSLASAMLEILNKVRGFGLAANQVGVNRRMFVINVEPEYQAQFDSVYLNPKFEARSENETKLDEGCISFPYLFANISRADWVILSWFTLNGERKQHTFHGITARVMQHEMDHLEGKTILDHLTPFEKRRAQEKRAKDMKKAQRGKLKK